jgi:hypothetical protein
MVVVVVVFDGLIAVDSHGGKLKAFTCLLAGGKLTG